MWLGDVTAPIYLPAVIWWGNSQDNTIVTDYFRNKSGGLVTTLI